MKLQHIACITSSLLALHTLARAQIDFSQVGKIDLAGGGEIVAYTHDQHTLATTYFTGGGAGAT